MSKTERWVYSLPPIDWWGGWTPLAKEAKALLELAPQDFQDEAAEIFAHARYANEDSLLNSGPHALDNVLNFAHVIASGERKEIRPDRLFDTWEELTRELKTAIYFLGRYSDWNGDGAWYASPLPLPDGGGSFPHIVLAVKQQKSGTTYVVSPASIPQMENNRDIEWRHGEDDF